MCVCLGKINTSQRILQCLDLPYELSRYVCFVCVLCVCVCILSIAVCVCVYFGPNGKIKKYCCLRKICVAWRKTCGKAKKFFIVFFVSIFGFTFQHLVWYFLLVFWSECVGVGVWVWLWYWLCWQQQQQQQHTQRERESCCCCHHWTYLLRGHIVGACTQIDACIRIDAGQDEEDTCR